MATMRVSRPGYGGNSNQKPPHMILRNAQGTTIKVYRSPRATDHTGHGQTWAEGQRAGRQSVHRRSAEKTPSFSVQITLGHEDWYKEVGAELTRYIGFAKSKSPITVTYSKGESGLFYITDFSYTVELRSPFTNEPTRAQVSLTFTKANKDTIKTGPVSKAPAPVKKPSTANKTLRKHKVVKGDTLSHLALRYYGNAYKWPKIADYNKIKNPRLLRIGTILTIPNL